MKVSLGITPSAQARDIAQAAEEIGYDRVWLYDSPSLYEDLWIHLAQCDRYGLYRTPGDG